MFGVVFVFLSLFVPSIDRLLFIYSISLFLLHIFIYLLFFRCVCEGCRSVSLIFRYIFQSFSVFHDLLPPAIKLLFCSSFTPCIVFFSLSSLNIVDFEPFLPFLVTLCILYISLCCVAFIMHLSLPLVLLLHHYIVLLGCSFILIVYFLYLFHIALLYELFLYFCAAPLRYLLIFTLFMEGMFSVMMGYIYFCLFILISLFFPSIFVE